MKTKTIQTLYAIIGIIAVVAIGLTNIVDNSDFTPLLITVVSWFLLYAIIRPLCIIANHYERLG